MLELVIFSNGLLNVSLWSMEKAEGCSKETMYQLLAALKQSHGLHGL